MVPATRAAVFRHLEERQEVPPLWLYFNAVVPLPLGVDALLRQGGEGDLTITITTKDMDANENIVARLKQWMEDEWNNRGEC